MNDGRVSLKRAWRLIPFMMLLYVANSRPAHSQAGL
jgi:hypothetical protein